MSFDADFKMFEPSTTVGGRRSSTKPLASINGSGVLRFNAAAKKKFNLSGDTYVVAYYSAKKKILGLKIVERGAPRCLKFNNAAKTSKDACLGIKKLMGDFFLGNITQPGRELTYDKDEKIILIHNVEQLDEKAAFARSIGKAAK